MPSTNNHIDYIEFKSIDIEQTKAFYSEVFDWKFTDYGPTYVSFENSGLYGGFELTDKPVINGVLVVLYHTDLTILMKQILEAGGQISNRSAYGESSEHIVDPESPSQYHRPMIKGRIG